MTLTLPNDTLSTTFDSTESDANFAAIKTKFATAINNADIATGAAISLSKMETINQEVWLELMFSALDFGAGWPAAAAAGATPTKDELLDFVPLPGSDADTAWVVTDVSWISNDTGTVAGSFDVRYGAYDGAGAMQGAGTVVTGASMTAVGADLGAQGRALEDGSVTLTQGATVRGLYLVSAGAGTNVLDDTGGAGAKPSWLKVTVALKRAVFA